MAKLNVFLIANPVIAIVARQFISAMEMRPEDVLILFVRGQKYEFFQNYRTEYIERTFFLKLSKYLPRIFMAYPVYLRKHIESYKRNFILHTSWLDQLSTEIIKSDNCIGHVYLEEGDQAYKNFPVFPSHPDYERPVKTELNKHVYNHYWRDDALKWVGLSECSFPTAPAEKKVILKNLCAVKDNYKPKLKSGDIILLLPTPGRLPKSHWLDAIKSLNLYPEKPAYLKLHPAFGELPSARKQIRSMLVASGINNIRLCDKNVVLEVEMLFHPLVLIGDRSSLSRNAENFGSQFVTVPFLCGEYY